MKEPSFKPSDYQPPFPQSRFLIEERPGSEAVEMDVVIVGGGPAGLAAAIELARLSRGKLQIAVLEKAKALGGHSLSGAIIDPRPFRTLFPALRDEDFPFRGAVPRDRVYYLTEHRRVRVPHPPTMGNKGNYVASICEVVRWLGKKAEELGVNVFTGFPADSLLIDKSQVFGVRTTAAGLDREGHPTASSLPPTDLSAKVTVLAEGSRGSLSQAFFRWRKIASPAPQIYALGVKELWRTRETPRAVIHTLGWPLPDNAFGGSFLYPMGERLASLGLVVGLDYRQARLDVHELLQSLKTHPLFRKHLDGGELLEWGAKTIPEGGYYSLPERLTGDGVLVTGDSAGLVNVAALKGIHYAVQSGILAARAIWDAIEAGDCSAEGLSLYDRWVREGWIAGELHRTRKMRLAFKAGLFAGGRRAALSTLTRGLLPRDSLWRDSLEEDALVARESGERGLVARSPEPGLSKVDAVFRSGNATRDDIPNHLLAKGYVPPEVGEFYSHMCPAGVFELREGRLNIHASNCIDCKTTDILGPRWTPREGGSGPDYKGM